MDSATIASAIIDMLNEQGDGLTFVQLERIPGFRGDVPIFTAPGSNVLLWRHGSAAAMTALQHLTDLDIILARATNHRTYWAEGFQQTLPIATRQSAYQTLHWLPVAFYRGPRFLRPQHDTRN